MNGEGGEDYERPEIENEETSEEGHGRIEHRSNFLSTDLSSRAVCIRRAQPSPARTGRGAEDGSGVGLGGLRSMPTRDQVSSRNWSGGRNRLAGRKVGPPEQQQFQSTLVDRGAGDRDLQFFPSMQRTRLEDIVSVWLIIASFRLGRRYSIRLIQIDVHLVGNLVSGLKYPVE